MTNSIKRPWQGTTIAWLTILMLLGMMIATIVGLYSFLVSFVISQVPKIAASFLGVFPITLITVFIMIIILTLLIKGLFSGSKLAVVVATISIGLNVIADIFSILKFIFKLDFKDAGLASVGTAIAIVLLWLLIICLKHPFYGGNGKITLDTFKFWKKRAIRSDEMTTF